MMYLIAGGLLGAAVAILTLPWSRRDPDDFSTVDFGYAWRGPRGAVIAAPRVLFDAGLAARSRRRGIARNDRPLPRGLDPLTRAVYGGIGESRRPAMLLRLRSVQKAMSPVAHRVIGARLRVGVTRRVLGTAAAAAALVIVLVTTVTGANDLTTGVIVGVVALAVTWWLVRLRGITLAGARTMAASLADDDVPSRGRARLSAAMAGVMVGHSGVPAGYSAMDDFDYGSCGDSDGGGGDSGGDSSC